MKPHNLSFLAIASLLALTTLGACTEPAPQIVGGDSDEHGCIGSAGYSWCAATNKCIRVWEEECSSEDEAAIRSLFAKEHERKVAEVSLTNPQITGNFARGGVSFVEAGTEPGSASPGGLFLAFKKDGNWTIVFEGNGAADCNAVEEYGFPSAILEGICY